MTAEKRKKRMAASLVSKGVEVKIEEVQKIGGGNNLIYTALLFLQLTILLNTHYIIIQ